MFALGYTLLHLFAAGITRQQTRKSMKLIALADEKGDLIWKTWQCCTRLRIGADRQSLGRDPNDHSGIDRCGQRGNRMVPLWLSYLAGPMRNSANSMTLGAASARR